MGRRLFNYLRTGDPVQVLGGCLASLVLPALDHYVGFLHNVPPEALTPFILSMSNNIPCPRELSSVDILATEFTNLFSHSTSHLKPTNNHYREIACKILGLNEDPHLLEHVVASGQEDAWIRQFKLMKEPPMSPARGDEIIPPAFRTAVDTGNNPGGEVDCPLIRDSVISGRPFDYEPPVEEYKSPNKPVEESVKDSGDSEKKSPWVLIGGVVLMVSIVGIKMFIRSHLNS
ncbi:unnamed protein product [Discosporangium mesarthrocarpum]